MMAALEAGVKGVSDQEVKDNSKPRLAPLQLSVGKHDDPPAVGVASISE